MLLKKSTLSYISTMDREGSNSTVGACRTADQRCNYERVLYRMNDAISKNRTVVFCVIVPGEGVGGGTEGGQCNP